MYEQKHWKAKKKFDLIKGIRENGVVETCRKYGLDPTLFNRWNGSYENFDMERISLKTGSIELCSRRLKKGNERLKKIIAEKELKVSLPQGACKKRG